MSDACSRLVAGVLLIFLSAGVGYAPHYNSIVTGPSRRGAERFVLLSGDLPAARVAHPGFAMGGWPRCAVGLLLALAGPGVAAHLRRSTPFALLLSSTPVVCLIPLLPDLWLRRPHRVRDRGHDDIFPGLCLLPCWLRTLPPVSSDFFPSWRALAWSAVFVCWLCPPRYPRRHCIARRSSLQCDGAMIPNT